MKEGRFSETLKVHFVSRFRFDLLLTFVSCFIKERKFNCRWFTLSLVVSSSRSYVDCLRALQWEMKWLATERQVPLFTSVYKAKISLSFNFSFFLVLLLPNSSPPSRKLCSWANLWLNFYWVIAKTFLFFVNDRQSREKDNNKQIFVAIGKSTTLRYFRCRKVVSWDFVSEGVIRKVFKFI